MTVVGSKKSGKTTVVCSLVEQLKVAGYKVATMKFFERASRIDVNDKETDLHRKAGADITIASGVSETAILISTLQAHLRCARHRDTFPRGAGLAQSTALRLSFFLP